MHISSDIAKYIPSTVGTLHKHCLLFRKQSNQVLCDDRHIARDTLSNRRIANIFKYSRSKFFASCTVKALLNNTWLVIVLGICRIKKMLDMSLLVLADRTNSTVKISAWLTELQLKKGLSGTGAECEKTFICSRYSWPCKKYICRDGTLNNSGGSRCLYALDHSCDASSTSGVVNFFTGTNSLEDILLHILMNIS